MHFGVRAGDWQSLCMRLACRHVKGFQIAEKLGRRPGKDNKWAPWELERLRLTVEAHKKSKLGISDHQALLQLSKKDEWVKSKGVKVETLENRLQEAKAQHKLLKRDCQMDTRPQT
jgi:hypothetical protein